LRSYCATWIEGAKIRQKAEKWRYSATGHELRCQNTSKRGSQPESWHCSAKFCIWLALPARDHNMLILALGRQKMML
ncbi:hypothetical protein TorRG33x02_348800, partial [Trema orientale]